MKLLRNRHERPTPWLILVIVVTISIGCSEENPQVQLVGGDPVAGFDIQTGESNPDVVTFSNTSENAFSYQWKLGDGSTFITRDVEHTYDSSAQYTVELTVTNRGGEKLDAIVQEFEVSAPPQIIYDITGTTHLVTFTNTTRHAHEYSWDFGDGITSTLKNPTHSYAADGAYEVRLDVVNTFNNETDSFVQVIQVASDGVTLAGFLSTLASAEGKIWTPAEVEGPIKVGPDAGSGEWWGGPALAELSGGRSCIQDDEFTFFLDGTYTFDSQGSTFFEDYLGGDFSCADPATFPAPFDALADNTHSFTITETTDTERTIITVNGIGAFIGFPRASNEEQHSASTIELASSISYELYEYIESNVNGKEQIVLSVNYGGGWWTYTLEAEN